MDLRVQQALDDELTRAGLSREEAAAVAEAEVLIPGVSSGGPKSAHSKSRSRDTGGGSKRFQHPR